MRRHRIRPPGVEIWRLADRVNEPLKGFGEKGFFKMFARKDRADIYKAAGALHLIHRRQEVATVARVAEILDWTFPRARTALVALRERGAVERLRITNSFRLQTPFDSRCDPPLDESHFTPAGNESDPRLDGSDAHGQGDELDERRKAA